MCGFLRSQAIARRAAGGIAALLLVTAWMPGTTMVYGHELWIETEPAAKVGQTHTMHICCGHAVEKATGDSLAAQQSKISTWVLGPGGRESVGLAPASDSFVAKFAPGSPGNYLRSALPEPSWG